MIFICVRAGQPADGVTVAVKRACKLLAIGIFADGRPLGVVHGDVLRQAGVDVGFVLVVYLVGKPAQLPLVGNFVIGIAVRCCFLLCRFPCTAAFANAGFIIKIVMVKCLVGLIAVAFAGGIRFRLVNLVTRIAAKHGGFVRADTLPPNLRGGCAKGALQLVRHIAVSELECGFGFAICAYAGSSANSLCICIKVIAVFHSAVGHVIAAHAADSICAGNRTGVIASVHSGAIAAAFFVPAAHAADSICAGNRTGVIAVFHSAVVAIAAHAADIYIAGNRTGVIAFLYGGRAVQVGGVHAAHAADRVPCAGNRTGVIAFLYDAAVAVLAAHTADRLCAGNRTGVVAALYGAAFVPPANAADTFITGHIGILEGDIFYGAILANVAEQANVVRIAIVKVQPGDSEIAAVKLACERIGFCANGRPLRGFIYEDVVRQPGVDGGLTVDAYLIGKPAQVAFVLDKIPAAVFLWFGVGSIQQFHRIGGGFAPQRQQRVGGGVIARQIQPCQFVIGKAFFCIVNVRQRLCHCLGVVVRHFVRQGVDHRLHLCRRVRGCRGFRRRLRGRRFRSVRRSRFLRRRCGGRLCRWLRGRCCRGGSRFLRGRLCRGGGFCHKGRLFRGGWVEVFLHGAYLRRLRQTLVQRQNAQGAKLQQQSHAQHGCKYPLCFHLVLLMYRKQPGRSKPPGFKAVQLLFAFFAPQQHKQHGGAQRQHQQKRGPGGIAGLRNTECGRGGLRRGRGGRRFTGRRLRAYRRGNCAGLQRGQQTVVLKLQHQIYTDAAFVHIYDLRTAAYAEVGGCILGQIERHVPHDLAVFQRGHGVVAGFDIVKAEAAVTAGDTGF